MLDDLRSDLSRRQLVKTSATAFGGFVIAFNVPFAGRVVFAQEAAKAAAAAPPPPNAFVRIGVDESITVMINKLEMGQGVNTSMAQLVAEELDVDWTKVRSESAPVDPVYNHPMMGIYMTGGSTALASSWDQYRKVGAAMREMLVSAAAARWNVPASECKAEKGVVKHKTKGTLTYGALAEDAAKLPIPPSPKLKSPKDFKVIGKSPARVDAAAKANGKAQYSLDVRLPGMVYAMIAHPPVPGATLTAVDDKAARAVPGVSDVVRFGDRVAVIGRNTFAARSGRDALSLIWNEGAHASLTSDGLLEAFRKRPRDTDPVAEEKGKVDEAMATATTKISAEYALPFLAHAAMEPLNVVINYDGQNAELWSGHQMPGIDRDAAAKVLGLAPEAVKVNIAYAGGSFGRRASKDSDYVVIAAELAKLVKKPLQVVWSREDDTRAMYYRPMNVHKVTLGLAGKKLVAWDHHVVCQSIMKGSPFEAFMIKNGIEETAVEGVTHAAYDIPVFRARLALEDTPYKTLWWRSVGHTHTAFVMETMIDELASATGKDPLALRREMLKGKKRHLAVLDLLAKRTGYPGKKAPAGRAYGLAIHESFGTVVGELVEASLDGKHPKVHKVWAVAHCGQVVHPEVAKSQIESGIVFGISSLSQEVKIEKGRVVTGNFDDYPVARITDMPEIDVAFVPSTDPPTGLGEPGVPPLAPAVANAYFALTKKRLRELPLTKSLV